MHDSPTQQDTDSIIRSLLTNARTIAMVGASANPDRDSYHVMRRMQKWGYRVIPVNPLLTGQELNGETVRPSLSAIGEPVDIVDIFRRSDQVAPVIDEAISTGAGAIWMQIGVIDETSAERARQAGFPVVMNRCLTVEYRRLHIG